MISRRSVGTRHPEAPPISAQRVSRPNVTRLVNAPANDRDDRRDGESPDVQTVATGIDQARQTGLFAYAVRRDDRGRLRLASAWPLWALLVPFPLWWALGLTSFIFPLLAVPMASTLWRRWPIRLPRAWALWALFLAWTVLSLTMYGQSPTGAHPGSLSGRLVSTSVLLSEYASATVTMLFVGNLRRHELPLATLVRWLGSLFIVTVAGGLLGTFAPHFGFTSPFEMLLPHSLRSDPYISALVHPNASQVQSVLGANESGRAAAPFGYTNFWANNVGILIIWFVCGWGLSRNVHRRIACVAIVALSVIPIVYSLNRGLWLGLGFSVLWVAGRLFLHGRVGALLIVFAAVAIGVLAFTLTPLHSMFNQRLAHPESNNIRSFLSSKAVAGAVESPILGWGGTRKTNGSNQSIAIGKTPKCPQCGEFAIGSNGQLWTVLFYQGFVGTGFYLGFFAASILIYRRDHTTYGQAGILVVGLTFIFMTVYVPVPSSLTITMISIGILWRSRDEQAVRPAVLRIGPGASTRL